VRDFKDLFKCRTGSVLPTPARIIHKPRREVPEMPVMVRKTTETTAGVFVDTLGIDEGV
jgi:hypothetical protein